MKPESGHYYTPDGQAAHFVPRADGKGQRPTMVSDARKLSLLPSPTTILKVLNKPALIEWMVKTAVAAFATAPDVPGESLDDKITRVLETERQQDQESTIAKDRGTEIHEAIELALNDVEWNRELTPFVAPVIEEIMKIGRVVATEKILVGVGCAGKTDCVVQMDVDTPYAGMMTVIDFKTCKKLPDKGPWPEHKMQASFYTHALGNVGNHRKQYAIIYISTQEPGKIACFVCDDWQEHYKRFRLIQDYWYLSNNVPMPYAASDEPKPLPF